MHKSIPLQQIPWLLRCQETSIPSIDFLVNVNLPCKRKDFNANTVVGNDRKWEHICMFPQMNLVEYVAIFPIGAPSIHWKRFLLHVLFPWLSARLQYFYCWLTGDTAICTKPSILAYLRSWHMCGHYCACICNSAFSDVRPAPTPDQNVYHARTHFREERGNFSKVGANSRNQEKGVIFHA